MNYPWHAIRLLAAALALAALTASLNAQENSEPQFVSMFDGKTLDGWSVIPATAAKAWTAEDGMIVGDGDKGRSYLQYDRNTEIADFEMTFSYRFPQEHGNSGVNIRSIKDETGRREFQSYHVDLGHVGIGRNVLGAWDFHTPGRIEHGVSRGDRLVIDEHDKPTISKIDGAVTLDDINKADWNDVRVIVKGNNFKFSINGKPSAEFTEYLPDEKRLHKGAIQLQLHDPGMIVQFKDLKIKVLK